MNDFMYSIREGTIRFNYSRALQQAERLEEIAARIKGEICGNISDIIETSRCCWKGNPANNYCEKLRRLLEELRVAAVNYEKIAQTIRSIAKRNFDKEMRAIQIARERSYRNSGSAGGGFSGGGSHGGGGGGW